jgi:hypothetical protein
VVVQLRWPHAFCMGLWGGYLVSCIFFCEWQRLAGCYLRTSGASEIALNYP